MATTRKSTTKRATKKPATKKVNSAKTTRKTTTKTSPTLNKSAKKPTVVTIENNKTTSLKSGTKTTSASRGVFERLRNMNLAVAMIQLAQAAAVVLLDKTHLALPVSTNYSTTDSLASLGASQVLVPATKNLLDLRLSYVLAAILVISALMHIKVATVRRERYEVGLTNETNRERWIGGALVYGLMIVVISMIIGISDKSLLLMLFSSTAVMLLTGWALERNRVLGQRVNPVSYLIGLLSGLAPWLVIAWYLIMTMRSGEVTYDSFVYVLVGSMALIYLALIYLHNMQLRRTGSYSVYANVERAFILLSLIATSALTWQVFASLLK
ncbi:MAG: heliorhodopsin HeR [bacterium]|nr:heliorhodopsin HeR [bacterium]